MPDEWRRLEKFATYAEELTHITLLSTPSRLAFSIRHAAEGVTFEPTAIPDSQQISELLHRLRPFVLESEPTYFLSVRNILARRLSHSAFRAYLDRQKDVFAGRRCQAIRVVSHGTLINSTETLDLWLNAYEYHRDHEKREKFEALHDGNLPREYSRALFIHILLDRARAVVDIGNAIYALQRNLVVTPLPGDLA
jgi:hypothetical protein